MELRHLRYFVAVADEQHMGRAAEQLRVAQSALSKQIQDLERELGVLLFDRLPRGLQLSEAGRVFLGHARSTLSEADAGLRAARAAAAGSTGTIRIGTPDWGSRPQFVANAVAHFRTQRPNASIEFDSTPWPMHPLALRERKLDVGFGLAATAEDFGPELGAALLAPEPARSAVLPATHPLAAQPTVTPRELEALPFVYFERALFPPLYDASLAALVAAGFQRTREILAMPSFAAAAQLVASGAGWTYVVDSVASVPPPGTVVRPISAVMRLLGFFTVWRRDDPNPLAQALVRSLQDIASQTEDNAPPVTA